MTQLSTTSAAFAVRFTGRPCGPDARSCAGAKRFTGSSTRKDWPAVSATTLPRLRPPRSAMNPRRLVRARGSDSAGAGSRSIHAKTRPVSPAAWRLPVRRRSSSWHLEVGIRVLLVGARARPLASYASRLRQYAR